VKGAVQARVIHSLRLDESAGPARALFRGTTRIDLTPMRTPVDRLELALPSDYDYDAKVGPTPAEIVEEVLPDRNNQLILVKLAHRQVKPFSIVLRGSYPVPEGREDASLELVRPLAWSSERAVAKDRSGGSGAAILDRGAVLNLLLPEDRELLP